MVSQQKLLYLATQRLQLAGCEYVAIKRQTLPCHALPFFFSLSASSGLDDRMIFDLSICCLLLPNFRKDVKISFTFPDFPKPTPLKHDFRILESSRRDGPLRRWGPLNLQRHSILDRFLVSFPSLHSFTILYVLHLFGTLKALHCRRNAAKQLDKLDNAFSSNVGPKIHGHVHQGLIANDQRS